MAHGDYDCCAICDCKLNYNPYLAKEKEDICTDCLKKLRDKEVALKGRTILTVDELIEWINEEGLEAVKILEEIGFSECYYVNDVDAAVRRVKGDKDGN